jgi:opacity protein-like surface antigen
MHGGKIMKKVVCALLISAAAVSAPAFAEGFMDTPVGSKYVAADVGQISYGGNAATALSVGFGYQVSEPVGIEVDYLHGGTYTQSYYVPGITLQGSSEQLSALQVMAVGHYNFNDSFGVYAKAGIEHNMDKYTSTNIDYIFPALSYSVSGTNATNDLAFGVGGTYAVTNNIKLRVQYMETGLSSVNTLSFGAQFGF